MNDTTDDTKNFNFMSRNLPGGLVLASIQAKCRNALSINEFTMTISSTKFISCENFQNLLQTHEIFLNEKELASIERKCSSGTKDLDSAKLLRYIDIGIPDSYTDLDQFIDPLPQPYRMISKIIEVWCYIVASTILFKIIFMCIVSWR
jgi:hypothetical protein